MKLLSSLAVLAMSTVVAATTPFVTRTNVLDMVSANSLFGVRGGGLFGGKGDAPKTAEPEAPAEAGAAPAKMYPAMTEDEIEEWLGHIPVFAVTDANGSGVVLKPDEESSVFYFFMSPQMANATLTQLKSTNEELDLRISAFSLGKIWFRVLNSDKPTAVQLKEPGSDAEAGPTESNVEYRLVPDTRDLLGARMLLTMNPEDGEALKNGGSLTPEMAQAAIQKAMTEAPKFNATYNEIPVFMIQQMRMQKQPAEDEEDGEVVTLLPMYFNLQNMVALWQQFTAQTPEIKDVEPAINLMDLYELVAKMQEESEIDFRNVVLIPSTPLGGAAPEQAAGPSGDDPFKMPGDTTLGDL